MQKPLLPVRAVTLSRLKGGGIGSRTETCLNWGGPIATVLYLHQGNIYIARKLRVWRDWKCIPIVGAKSPCTCASRQTTPFQKSQYRPESGNLRKLGWTYHQCNMFAPRQYLYQREAMGMERPEMYSSTWCKNPAYLFGPSKYSISRESV